jgi:hypothetical protein
MTNSERKKQEFLAKIADEQEEVPSLLRQGWELGRSCLTGKYWAQAEGLSSGKTSITINARTIEILLEKGIIYIKRDDGRLPTLYDLK